MGVWLFSRELATHSAINSENTVLHASVRPRPDGHGRVGAARTVVRRADALDRRKRGSDERRRDASAIVLVIASAARCPRYLGGYLFSDPHDQPIGTDSGTWTVATPTLTNQ